MNEEQNSTNAMVEDEAKNIAVISYITIIGLIVAFVMNNDKKYPFARYHISQSLGLALTGLVLGIVAMIPILGWIIYILGFFVIVYMWIMGLLNAVNKVEKPVPIMGKHYEKWFANI